MLAGALGLATAAGALGQVFKWVDENGRVHYGERKPPAAKATTLTYKPSHSANPEANVEIEESAIEYYPIRGTTPLELHMSMIHNGPFNEIVQRRVYAEIATRYRWKFDYTREAGKCRINKFVVTLSATITMPRWLDEANGTPEARAIWPTVLAKIRQHEDGHKAISTEGANVLARRLQALPAYETCEELSRVIGSEGARISGEYRLANRAFDRTEALKDSPFKR